MSGNSHTQSLVIGDKRIKVDSIAKKVEQDILFLQDRILVIKNQKMPNTVILKTYEEMLASRLSVLNWLKEYSPAIDDDDLEDSLRMTS